MIIDDIPLSADLTMIDFPQTPSGPGLVTLAEVKLHLRIDTNAEDNDLLLKIAGASAAVAHYLKWTTLPPPEDIPSIARNATLVMVGYLYREREGSNEYAIPERFGYGYLPAAVTALLYPLRRPTFA